MVSSSASLYDDPLDGDLAAGLCEGPRPFAHGSHDEDGGVPMNRRILLLTSPLLAAETGDWWAADPPGDIRELKLRDWEPQSMMVTKTTIVEKPMFPVIDVHNHLGGGKERLTPAVVKRYLTEMNEAGVRTVVNLDGGWGDRLKETLAALDEAHPGRFLTFALVNFDGIDDDDWGSREAERLEESFQAGAKGLKFHKTLGLATATRTAG